MTAANAAPASVRLLGSLLWTLGLMVLAGIVLGATLLAHSAQEQDRVVAEASQDMFDALLTLQAQRLAGSVRDYAYWDEAVDRVPGAYDLAWWEENAGTFVVDGFGLSFSLAVDGADRARLLTVAGEPTRADLPGTVIAPSMHAVLREARARPAAVDTSEVATGLVRFGGALHLAAAVGFAPEGEDSPPNPDPGALLVFAYSFEDHVLVDAANIMGVADMELVEAPPTTGTSLAVALGGGGSPVIVSWAPPKPGRSMLGGALVPFGATTVAMIALIGFFVVRARRLAFDLHVQDRTRLQLAARNESILEAAGEGIFGVDERGLAVFANAAALAATGYRLDEFIGADPHSLLGCKGRHVAGEVDVCPIRSVLADGRAVATDTEAFVGANGRPFPVEYSVSPIKQAEQVIGAVVVFRDITERRRTEEEVRYRANYDGLTGLPNRNLIVERLGQAVARAQRTDTQVAAMFLDLDDFKEVNDSLGHHAGDRLLCEAGERLMSCVRATDSVGRLGGDEFVVLLTEVSGPRDAAIVAEKVLEALAAPFDLDGQQAWVGCSVGIALFPGDGEDASELLRHADLAMYEAKGRGRHVFSFYRRALTATVRERRGLEVDLRRALERHELTLYYQPVVGLADGRVAHVEALVRWRHPERGLLLPEVFVPLAEDTGLIADLGVWVLDEGCRQLASWRAAGIDVDLAINVSGRQVPRGLPGGAVEAALREHGVPAGALLLELTESVLLDRSPPVAHWLRAVRELGVRLVLDDFGTGYSSLACLEHLDLHALKIDRSFTADLLERDASRTIVTAILAMAEGLGLTVVAEGVETEAQAAWLHANDCRFGQGFAFARPCPAAELVDLPRLAIGI